MSVETGENLPGSPTLVVMPVVFFNLLVYFVIGLPNAVIGAQFVHSTLGFSTAVAGMTITLQYLGTFLTRLVAGQLVDKFGPKKILTYGLIACTISGLLVCVASAMPGIIGVTGASATLILGIAILSRLFIGWAESWTATSVTTWNIRRVGSEHASVAISWNGVTSYGGIALGVSVGKWLSGMNLFPIGLMSVGILSTLLGIGGFILLLFYKGVKPLPKKGAPMSFFTALRKVLPYGAGLAAGSFGFGTVNGYLSIYYNSQHWQGIGIAFGTFAAVFVAVRILFASQIDKRGGIPVAFISLITEAVAMAVFCTMHTELGGLLGAALTGAGFSLLFPALGTMAVKTDGPEFGGILIAAYSVFTDLTIAIVGPLMGFIQGHLGWYVMFGTVGVLCLSGIFFTTVLARIPGCGIQKTS
ncbi:MFS transporter [Saccharibacter sp. 17.LH.SD]|uniref:MFS transporter n=1 Tax=Saccharibacter sp. 17.LH.SD TaxID=2689393 RepID=UPI001370D62A|nr:MFS transporter [Saccharibacter sp. 17.LH.SD]MXV44980.1 MFS transporter [Saccharibacter sp. 17.LH.SD]